MVRSALVTVTATILLAACGSIGTANVAPGYTPGPNGLLLVSLSASGYLPGTLWMQVVPASDVARVAASIPVNDAAYGIDWPAGDPAVANGGLGRLAAIELSPGEYELRRWVINVGNSEAYTSRRPLGYRFRIEAGKATYLGGVHLDIQRSAARSLPAQVRLEDRRERDLALLRQRYPGVRDAQLVFAADAGRREAPETRRSSLPARMDDLKGLLPSQ